MAALPPVPKVVRVDFKGFFRGTIPVQNRVFFQYGGTLSQADAQTWVDSMATQWGTKVMLHLDAQYTLTSTVLTDLTSATAAQAISANTGTGGASLTELSAGTAIVVKQKIARRYRGGHPRHYLVGTGTAMFASASSNAWSTTAISNLKTDWDGFVTAVLSAVPAAAAPATEVNVSYFSGFHSVTFPSGRVRSVPTVRATPVVDLVLSHSVNPKVASQRRRNLQST